MTGFAWIAAAAWSSPWIDPAGSVRVGASAWGLSSVRQFASGEARGLTGPLCPEPLFGGDRGPYSCVTGGRYTLAAGAADFTAGLTRHLAVDLMVPVVSATFSDDIGREPASGLGDLRLVGRLGRTFGPVAGALALQIKAPTGPASFVDRDVPLGDGQWDLIPGLRAGAGGARGWAETWQSLAVRLRAPKSGIDPGEEWQGILAGGVSPVDPVGALARIEWLLAAKDIDAFGLPHPGRRLVQVRAGLFARPSRALWTEIGVAVPIAGRRWPAAAVPYASVSWRVRDPSRNE